MKLKLKTEDVLNSKELMDVLVAYHRDEGMKWIALFESFQDEEYSELEEETCGGGWEDFEPYYTHITKGEYGNCLLILYRLKYEYSEEEKQALVEDLKGKKREEALNYFDIERRSVFGMYSYQHKGMIKSEWFSAVLAKEVEFQI